MLYVFFGTDTRKVRDQANRLVASLCAKRPDAHVFSFSIEDEPYQAIESLVDASGLFVERHIILLTGMHENATGREFMKERMARFADSQNIIILVEGKLLAEQKRLIERHTSHTEEHTVPEKGKSEFNVFALVDALMARDRRQLWTTYRSARAAGVAPENVQGTLHWGVKALLAARDAKHAAEVGQKEAQFGRYKRAAQAFSREELVALSRTLIQIYHDAHRGSVDFDAAIERWCLGV